MSGGHGHGGHRHGGGHFRRHGITYSPTVLLYDLYCDPTDPLYKECLARFGNDATFAGLTTPDDIDAIRVYFDQTVVQTPEAQQIKDAFVRWYDDLSWFAKTEQATFDLARNQRNRFNLANVTTPEEKTRVQEVITQGLSEEQLQGAPDRRNENGMLPGPVKPPPPPLVPTKYLLGGAAVAGVAFIAWAYGKGKG